MTKDENGDDLMVMPMQERAKWSLFGEELSGGTVAVNVLGVACGPEVGVAWVQDFERDGSFSALLAPGGYLSELYRGYRDELERLVSPSGRTPRIALVVEAPLEAIVAVRPEAFGEVTAVPPVPRDCESTSSLDGTVLGTISVAVLRAKSGLIWGGRFVSAPDETGDGYFAPMLFVGTREDVTRANDVLRSNAARIPDDQVPVVKLPGSRCFDIPNWFLANALTAA